MVALGDSLGMILAAVILLKILACPLSWTSPRAPRVEHIHNNCVLQARRASCDPCAAAPSVS
eukprot:1682387-Lingulodinium_polyedra.AAC.1